MANGLPETQARLASARAFCLAVADCEPEDAAFLMSGILQRMSVGAPPPVFISAMDDARWWASRATPHELKAYCLASFKAMTPKTQRDFLAHVQRGAAA